MKKDAMNTCPGCKRHCPMGAAKCKYGRNYFEKNSEKIAAKQEGSGRAEKKEKKRAWERSLLPGGAAQQLIAFARSARKALKRGAITEQQLTGSLTETEKQTLCTLLEKMNRGISRLSDV